jgi:hypothetical protein
MKILKSDWEFCFFVQCRFREDPAGCHGTSFVAMDLELAPTTVARCQTDETTRDNTVSSYQLVPKIITLDFHLLFVRQT